MAEHGDFHRATGSYKSQSAYTCGLDYSETTNCVFFFFAGTSECWNAAFHSFVFKNSTSLSRFFLFVQLLNSVSHCAVTHVGFALKLAEALNGFLRALLETPLTPSAGGAFEVLVVSFSVVINWTKQANVIGDRWMEPSSYCASNIIGLMLISTRFEPNYHTIQGSVSNGAKERRAIFMEDVRRVTVGRAQV